MAGRAALALAVVLPLAAMAPPARADQAPRPLVLKDSAVASRGGLLWMQPNPDALQALGLRVPARGREWQFALLPREPVTIALGDGAPTALLGGALELPGLQFVRADGQRSPPLRLVPAEKRLDWRVEDARGGVWLSIERGMRSPDVAKDGFSLITAAVRSGPAFSRWSGKGESRLPFGAARLHLPFDGAVAPAKSCTAPNFPGTPGYVTDVSLVAMNEILVPRCHTAGVSGCDGPGGNDGVMVLTPGLLLRNHTGPDAADVPWHNKFTGVFPPYGNDQHPFLVWNAYRFDAEGRIAQIARSGLKHAFATQNEGCLDATCQATSQILGRACSDEYNWASNDVGSFLAPRREVIPARGIWGRCGSVHDDVDNNPDDGLPGCDGAQDSYPDDLFRDRLALPESSVDPALNPGATLLMEAWYVVRDDRAIYNSMGSKTFAPQYNGSSWNAGPLGAFVPGAVLDRWLAAAPAGTRVHRAELSSAEGTVVVATRIRQLPDLRWQYDYAVMNFDFSRAVTEGSEPNLRVVRNFGLSGVAFSLGNGATVDASAFSDGDASAGNDWTLATSPASIAWSTAVAPLDWGRLVSFRVTSPAAPGDGQVTLSVAEAGAPASYLLAAPVPDAAAIFSDGFD